MGAYRRFEPNGTRHQADMETGARPFVTDVRLRAEATYFWSRMRLWDLLWSLFRTTGEPDGAMMVLLDDEAFCAAAELDRLCDVYGACGSAPRLCTLYRRLLVAAASELPDRPCNPALGFADADAAFKSLSFMAQSAQECDRLATAGALDRAERSCALQVALGTGKVGNALFLSEEPDALPCAAGALVEALMACDRELFGALVPQGCACVA